MPADIFPDIDTPALLVDLDVMERNIARMAELAASNGVALRPHIKTHKSPWIASQQLQAGARGITVAKLGEAEVMADAGITDILVAYPIVGPLKLKRLAHLMERARITVGLDSIEAAECVAQAARAAGQIARIYVDVDTGLQRLGQPTGAPTAQLATAIARLPNVEVVGLMTHAGHLGQANTEAELATAARLAAEQLVETAALLRRQGLPIQEVSPGSTPGARYDCQTPGVTEVRPGTYVFNDRNCIVRWAAEPADCALTVLATVVSRPDERRAVIDAGGKTFGADQVAGGIGGYGLVLDRPGITVTRLSEEHGVLSGPPDTELAVGDRVRVIPNHVCAAVNLADELYGVRGQQVEREIPVVARGKRC